MEYHAVIRLLNSLPDGATVSVHSDSKLIINQLTKKWLINYGHLRSLADEVWRIVDSKKLRVSFFWVSRWDNPAGRFIEENERMIYHDGKP
jgi:ribonuclease HI